MRSMDTTAEAEQAQLEIFRRMGPEKRLQAGIALSQMCRKLLQPTLGSTYPAMIPAEALQLVLARLDE